MALARSESYLDRGDAGRCLALFAGLQDVDSQLVELMCDFENTWVTEKTVDALVRREDVIGWRLITRAYATDGDGHTRAHMVDAIEAALGGDWDAPSRAERLLRESLRDESAEVRARATELFANVECFSPHETQGDLARQRTARRTWPWSRRSG
jgi:hypothetical protein